MSKTNDLDIKTLDNGEVDYEFYVAQAHQARSEAIAKLFSRLGHWLKQTLTLRQHTEAAESYSEYLKTARLMRHEFNNGRHQDSDHYIAQRLMAGH
ncbi:MAG: hypothetical protein QGG88_05375 [Gammaproteobacteria bacterium]|nr:hypothetical protein [Gammaproteobacteria bacterium]